MNLERDTILKPAKKCSCEVISESKPGGRKKGAYHHTSDTKGMGMVGNSCGQLALSEGYAARGTTLSLKRKDRFDT